MADSTEPLTEVEMIEILKEIAREGQNAAARIAAIKQLREMGEDGEQPAASGFQALDELEPRRRKA